MQLKLNRRIHDAHASLSHWIGKSIDRIEKHAKIESRSVVAEAETEVLDNSFEFNIIGSSPTVTVNNPEVTLYTLRDVYLCGDRGYPFFTQSELFNVCQDVAKEPAKKIRRPIKVLAKNLKGTYFHLTGSNHENRGHFLMQHFPRFLACMPILEKDPSIKIIIATGHPWQREFLELFGISQGRIIEATPGTIKCEKLLYVPVFYGDNNLCHARFYRDLKNLLYKKFNIQPKPEKVLYISRKGADERVLINEDEVLAILEKTFGEVHLVDFPSLSLQQRIELFAQAKMVLGPQGQGLTTFMYCSAQAKTIVLENGSYRKAWATAYRDLGLMMGCQSACLFSNAEPGKKQAWAFPSDSVYKWLSTTNAVGQTP